MLTEKDELRHSHDRDSTWRESLYWGFVLPEASLGLLAYLRLDPNAGIVSPMVLVYRGSGEVVYAFNKAYPLPPKLELDEVNLEGFRFSGLRPLSACALAFTDGAGTSLEFHFTGLHPPFEYAQNRTGCPRYLATNRFEQAGRFEGTLRLKDETFPLSLYGQRDHSWGTRDWDAIQHYKWIAAQNRDGAALNLTYSVVRGEVAFNGYVYSGGKMEGIVRADINTTYAGDGITHRAISAAVFDEGGRTTRLDATMFAVTELPMEQSVVVEGAARVAIDGIPGAGIFEWLWPKDYFNHLKRHDLNAARSQPG
jgi:hypothetical protein